MSRIGYAKESHYKPTKNVCMSEETLKAIKDFQFEARKDNFSIAAEELIQLGLKVIERRKQRHA